MLDFRSFVEMPIQVNLLGNWQDKDKTYRWDKPSIGILTSPVGVEKITQKWSKLPQQFNAWMLKGPGASKYREVGEVQPEFITNNLKLKIVPNPQKPDEISIDPNAINVIYTQNVGAEKVPFTAWLIAHRFGHAIKNDQVFKHLSTELERDVKEIMQSMFGRQPSKSSWGGYDSKGYKFLTQFVNALGTMGSARKGAIRTFFEFPYELLAQFMLTGKIRFNRLPFKILDYYTWGRPQYIRPQWALKEDDFERWNGYISHMEEKYQQLLEEIVERCVGHIFVM
jgi:hypothetical protein